MNSGDSPPVISSLGFEIKEKLRKKSGIPGALRKDHILVVHDDAAMRRVLGVRLSAAGYEVDLVNDAKSALDACTRSRPDLVITDLRLHARGMDGLALLKESKSRWPELSVILLTAFATIPEAVEATSCGAFGFLVEPVTKVELLGQVQRALAASAGSATKGGWRADIVSRCQLMQDRLAQANRAAATESPIMLTGETGTGKELFARAIHAASARRAGPFIAVTCQGLDERGLEAQMFGSASAPGAFQSALGGTLLLHEVCNLPAGLQARLINALQGCLSEADKPAGATVRIICTTSRDLRQQTLDGHFRADLYYRINVLPLEVPPLGRRREDIPLLVSHFLRQATADGGAAKMYSPQAVALLMSADWPGNVRQLSDVVKHNVVVSQFKVITEELVQQSLGEDYARVPSYVDARNRFLRDYLVNTLRSTDGNISKSALLAKRNRTDFYKLLARYRILANDFKQLTKR